MSTITIPAITRSQATHQYRVLNTRPAKFYKPKFVLSPAVRAQTLGAEWFKTDPMMPPYPYGPNTRFPEANEGLYGDLTIRSGNKISQGRNKGKTLRKWFPNIKVHSIWSPTLYRYLRLPIASRVMKTIWKSGGIDQYLTGDKPGRIKELGLVGWKLRWMIVNSPRWKKIFAKARAEAGLSEENYPNPLEETFEEAWKDDAKRAKLIEMQTEKWEKLKEKDAKFKKHFMQNIVSDRTTLKIPDLSTLSFYDPKSLSLDFVDVKEGPPSKRRDDSAGDVR